MGFFYEFLKIFCNFLDFLLEIYGKIFEFLQFFLLEISNWLESGKFEFLL